MTIVKNILSDLVEKRLWPVAALLVAALVAVPMTLAKPGEPTETATLPVIPREADNGPELALTRSTITGFNRAPRVNDKRLDPFGARYDDEFERALKRYLSGADKVIDGDSGGATASPGGGTDVGGSGGGGTGGGDDGKTKKPKATPKPDKDEPESTTPAVETEKDDLLTVLVSNANSEGEGESKEITDIRTLSPLPDTENPFLVYVGKTADGKVSFLVSADVTVTSLRGSCVPSMTDCRTLTLAVGDTADFVLTKQNNAKISITVTDLETKDVPVGGETTEAEGAASDDLATLESVTRAAGAKALKSVIRDEEVLRDLVKKGVRLRA